MSRQSASDNERLFWNFFTSPPEQQFVKLKGMKMKELKNTAAILGFERGWQKITTKHRKELQASLERTLKKFHAFHQSIVETRKLSHGNELPKTIRQLQNKKQKKNRVKAKSRGAAHADAPPPTKRQAHDPTQCIHSVMTKAFDAAIHLFPSGSGTVIAVDVPSVSPVDTEQENSKPSNSCLTITESMILTCAHCVDHDDDDDSASEEQQLKVNRAGRYKIALWSNGQFALVKCVAFNNRNDCALLRFLLDSGEISTVAGDVNRIAARLSDSPPQPGLNVVCIHNPYDWDLEAEDPRPTRSGYIPFTISVGRIEGYTSGDRRDASNLGPIIHSCWTYWGTSGAALFDCNDGQIVGMHNSWNDVNTDRHGASWEAICECVNGYCKSLESVQRGSSNTSGGSANKK